MTRDEKIDFLGRAIQHAWEKPLPPRLAWKLARELVDRVSAEVTADDDDFPIAL